jgi:small subunit ribosomal protein S18
MGTDSLLGPYSLKANNAESNFLIIIMKKHFLELNSNWGSSLFSQTKDGFTLYSPKSRGRNSVFQCKAGPTSSLFSEGKRYVNKPSSSQIEYKNLSSIRRFLTDQGKILSRRVTGLNSKQQRELTKAVKQARILGLLGFTTSSKESTEGLKESRNTSAKAKEVN